MTAPLPGSGENSAPPKIGSRIKAARQARRLTLEDLAAACGVTKGYLSKLERDHVNASVATLIRVCAALHMPVGALFDVASTGEVVRARAYPRLNFGGEGMIEYQLTPSTERRIQVLRSEIAPGGGSGTEPYELPVEINFVHVLDGQLRVIFERNSDDPVGASEVVLAAGDAFTFSPRQRHSFTAEGPSGAVVLWVLAPALPEGARSADNP